MKLKLTFFSVLLVFGQITFGQNFIVKEFNTNNGLISASNRKTIQSADNFYYTCSFGGLLRFDGSSFKSFTNADGLLNYRVNDLYEQRPGSFLLCNYYNLLHFDGSKFSKIKTNLPANTQFEKIIRLSNGTELVFTNLGAFSLAKNAKFYPYFLEKNIAINDLMEYQPEQFIYHNSEKNFIGYFSPKTKSWHHIPIPKGMEFSSFLSYKNAPIISTTTGLFTIKSTGFEIFKPNNFPGKLPLKIAFTDTQNREWLSDATGQLWLKKADSYENLSKKYKLANQVPLHFLQDKNNNIVITYEENIYVFKERFFEKIDLENRSPNGYFLGKYNNDTTFVALSEKGLLLIANGKKIIKPIDTSILTFTEPLKNGRYFRSAKYPEGILHVFRSGFYKIVGGKLLLFNPSKIEMLSLLRGFYDIDNEYFMTGGDGKLYLIGDKKIDTLNFEKYAKGLGPHSFIKTPKGTVLFVTSHKNLLKFKAGKLDDITADLQLKGKDFDIYWHKNSLWVIVLGIEIREYSFENEQLKLIKSISKKNGLLDANIGRFEIDNERNIWLNCFSGIYFLHIDRHKHVHSKKIPLSQNEEAAPLIENIFYNNNKIYAAGKNHVFEIATKSNMLNIKPIASYFSSIKANGKEILGPNTNIKNTIAVAFPADSNNLSFTPNTVYFGFDDAIQYQYKLEAAEAEWKTLAQGNTINYNNLANGNYVFKLRSVNNFSESYYTEAQFAFEIRPPFYKTWWFRSLMGLLAISAIYAFIRQRDAQKHRKNEMALQVTNLKLTALQSQMNPHFIFNSLNSIQNYIMQQKPLDAARYLSKFSKLMRRILDQSFSNLQPLSEIVETLKMYMELEAFRFSNEFSYEIKMDDEEQIAHVKLPPLILQPYVENAIIHGLMPKEGEKKLLIHLFLQNNELHCVVDDNGMGRGNKLAEKTGHISRGQKLTADMLATMKTLINADAKIEITDKMDSENRPIGTRIDLIIPII